MPGPDDDLALLIDAARAAGEIAARYWKTGVETWDKGGDEGPVTRADIEVDTMLRERLTSARPGHGWLSEETPDGPSRLSASHVFIADPIDGTRAFIDGSRNFAHSIALTVDGEVTAGVVYLPMKDQLFAAARGRGASLNGAPIHASTRSDEIDADLLITRPTLRPENWPGGPPPVTPHFRPSLAFRIAVVGEGRFDGMVTLRDSWEWDIAAGALIAAEAGATVTDRHGAPLRFNNPTPRLPGIIAAAPGLHQRLLARLA